MTVKSPWPLPSIILMHNLPLPFIAHLRREHRMLNQSEHLSQSRGFAMLPFSFIGSFRHHLWSEGLLKFSLRVGGLSTEIRPSNVISQASRSVGPGV